MKRATYKTLGDAAQQAKVIKDLRHGVLVRQQGYRERALKLFPHICAGCGREFSGKRLPELTVHHKDGDWKNNPPDGSNWELLCLYCHDHEHEKTLSKNRSISADSGAAEMSPSIFNPFEKLDLVIESSGEATDDGEAKPKGEA